MWKSNAELEEAFANAHQGMEQTVNFFRLLLERNLTFTAPYHPEIEGQHQIGSDGTLIVTTWKIGGEEIIPIFTSPERLDEAMQGRAKPGERYAAGEMIGRELLKGFAAPGNRLRVAINPGCSCGTHFLDPQRVQAILDGSALVIPTPGELAMNGLVISLPDRLPVSLREPLSKFFAGLPEVKAAWLFYEEEPRKPFEQVYVLGIATAGGDAHEIRHEAELAIAGLCPPEWSSRAIIMDAADPGFVDIMRCQPFYAAADFQPPPKPPAT